MPIFSRFGADFFTVYADFSRFVRDINGEKKNISLLMIVFSRLVFHRLPPLEILGVGVTGTFLNRDMHIQYGLQFAKPHRETTTPPSTLENPNLLKLRSLQSSCPFFLSDSSIWEQRTQVLQML